MTSALPPMNGVDRQQLTDTMATIEAEPALAQFQFRLHNRWLGGGENRSLVVDFHGVKEDIRHPRPFELVNDEPAALFGTGNAPNPAEYLLHALAGCLTTSIVYQAAARGLEIRGIATRLEGDIDLRGVLGMTDKVRNGFRNIRVAFEIDADMDDAQKQELMALGPQFSPIYDVVTNGVPVSCTLGGVETKQAA